MVRVRIGFKLTVSIMVRVSQTIGLHATILLTLYHCDTWNIVERTAYLWPLCIAGCGHKYFHPVVSSSFFFFYFLA